MHAVDLFKRKPQLPSEAKEWGRPAYAPDYPLLRLHPKTVDCFWRAAPGQPENGEGRNIVTIHFPHVTDIKQQSDLLGKYIELLPGASGKTTENGALLIQMSEHDFQKLGGNLVAPMAAAAR